MLRATIERLAGPDCGSVAEADLLADNLCNLVALLTACADAEHKAAQARLSDLDRMLAFDAPPSRRSGAFAADTRRTHAGLGAHVHKRFEAAEMSFGRALLDLRLDASRRALADPRCSGLTVTQIAYGAGFNDLSHFTNTFRARFGMPPGVFRRNASLSA